MEAAGTGPSAPSRLDELLEPLLSDPGASAVLTDVDGTIAPIVQDPAAASVPEETRELLGALAERYALVACVSGRPAADARRIVGLESIAYSGNHGYELLLPGDSEARPDPSLNGHEREAAGFVDGLGAAELERAGMRIEDKGAIVALHWRGSENEGEAESLASEIAADAEWKELVAQRGRKVLEIRPNVAINKGIAVAAMIASKPVRAALYGGDDRTDADAFAALRTLRDDGNLDAIACVAVGSNEAPLEVSAGADATVDGPEGFAGVLRALAA
ncbi:MAG: trehalose-phosphatase [Solirubrobacterales bacterium]|nr:trehalose-phosphatase [Solirubrobacterales bacterium]